MRKLLIEDYLPLQKAVARGLREAGMAVDVAGSETGTHCGLGLALARRAAAALGGTLTADIAGEFITISLIIPKRQTT